MSPSGKAYYFHSESGVTRWSPPEAAAALAPAAPKPSPPPPPPAPPEDVAAPSGLPLGWEEATAPDGRIYYYHGGKGATQWTRPTMGAEAELTA